jgi:hypothetical protein
MRNERFTSPINLVFPSIASRHRLSRRDLLADSVTVFISFIASGTVLIVRAADGNPGDLFIATDVLEESKRIPQCYWVLPGSCSAPDNPPFWHLRSFFDYVNYHIIRARSDF